MGLRIWVFLSLFFVVWLVAGCKETTDEVESGIAVYEVNIPDFVIETGETEYFGIIAKPESNIDYKVLQKVPDPNEGHAMRYAKPKRDQSRRRRGCDPSGQ